MTKDPLITVPLGTTLEEAQAKLHEHRIEKLPVVDEEGFLKGLITIKDILKKISYPNACKDALGRLRVAAAVGASGDLVERASEMVRRKVDCLVVDSAHGHAEGVLKAVERIKKEYEHVDVIGGNVSTEAGAADLIAAGADAVKVGQGPGGICTTPRRLRHRRPAGHPPSRRPHARLRARECRSSRMAASPSPATSSRPSSPGPTA